MINMPTRHCKTNYATIALPVFVLGHNPSTHIVVVSHTLDLAAKFGDDFRKLVESPFV
jgi:hypothetical protein